MRTTKIAPTECPICEGFGYTRGSADVMRCDAEGLEQSTVRKGWGCEFCLGTGQVDETERLIGLKSLRRNEIRKVS